MRLNQLIIPILLISFLFSFQIVNIKAQENQIDNLVKGTFDIKFLTATDLQIEVTMNVDQIIVFDTTSVVL